MLFGLSPSMVMDYFEEIDYFDYYLFCLKE